MYYTYFIGVLMVVSSLDGDIYLTLKMILKLFSRETCLRVPCSFSSHWGGTCTCVFSSSSW